MKKRVFITGATGFVGSFLVKYLLRENYQVLASRRPTTSLHRLTEVHNQISWVDLTHSNWTQIVVDFQPNLLVHAAWEGVTASDRLNWEIQLKNFIFFQQLLAIAKASKVSGIIGLGSQAEYGIYEDNVCETALEQPTTAYGAVKVLCMKLLKQFAQENETAWYWFRIFSTYGPTEDVTWLIPSTIQKLLDPSIAELDFTPAEQQVNYLYVEDAAAMMVQVFHINSEQNMYGVYNVAGYERTTLKDLLLELQRVSGITNKHLIFGALPYRIGQPMVLTGNTSKIRSILPSYKPVLLPEALSNTFNFYKILFQNESI